MRVLKKNTEKSHKPPKVSNIYCSVLLVWIVLNFVQRLQYFTCVLMALQAGIVFGGVCLSVRLSVQNLKNYWSEIDVTRQEYEPC